MEQAMKMTQKQMREESREADHGGEREAQGSIEAAKNLRNLQKTSRPVQRKVARR